MRLLPPLGPFSQPAAELLAATVERFEVDLDGMINEMVNAAIAAAPELASDIALEESVRASVRAMTLRWVEAERRRPGDPVPVDVPPAALDIARDLVRHGVALQHLMAGYRSAEHVGCRRWLLAAAEAVPAKHVASVAEFGQRAINSWVGDALEQIIRQIGQERDALLGGSLARQLEVVTLIVEGAPINEDVARHRLGYDLSGWHLGLVMSPLSSDHEQGLLEKAARSVARTMFLRSPLVLSASTTITWVWLSSGEHPIDVRAVRDALGGTASKVRVAAGTSSANMVGFRRTHREATAACRFADQRPGRGHFTAYEDVRLALLAAQDEEAAAQFVADTLGDLVDADVVLRETLRLYLQEDANTARAATRLFTHRNTVLNRLERAQRLLPQPLEGRHLSVGLALELLHWSAEDSSAGSRASLRDRGHGCDVWSTS